MTQFSSYPASEITAAHPGYYMFAEIAPDIGDPSVMKPTYQIIEGVSVAVFERLSKVVNSLPEPGEQPDIRQFDLVIPPIRLRSGMTIDDAFTLVHAFIRDDSSYRSYDLAPVPVDSTLTESNVRTANRIMARMSTATIEAVLASRGTIEAALKRVPIDASLTSESVPWEALRAVFAAFEDIPAVGLPRTTKILHKKRPALVPILDSVLEQYLVTNHDVGSQQRLADRGVALTRAFREELLENEDALRLLRAALSSQGIELTECRLLDIILWAYSGTYAPVWRRRRGMAASSSKRPGTGPIVVPPPLVAFVDNDTGYVSWIGQNPNGYVLNANRRPNAGYLKLHRASCPRISGDDGRRWTVQYAKVWAPTTLAIDSWTTSTLGVQPDRCPFCQP